MMNGWLSFYVDKPSGHNKMGDRNLSLTHHTLIIIVALSVVRNISLAIINYFLLVI
jgi:hypothetical protein